MQHESRQWRRTVLFSMLYRIAGPRPVVNPLVDALLGPRARVDDLEGAALVADAFRRASRRGMYAAIRWLSLRRTDMTPVTQQLSHLVGHLGGGCLAQRL